MLAVILTVVIIILCVFGISIAVDARTWELDDWEEYIEVVCREKNICPELIQAIIEWESGWNPKAVNGNCIGLMQIDKETHRERMEEMGITDLKDPYDNIMLGVDYLAELFKQYEDVYAVLMFYNAGYSKEYGLRAWEDGRYSEYAIDITRRAGELERSSGK